MLQDTPGKTRNAQQRQWLLPEKRPDLKRLKTFTLLNPHSGLRSGNLQDKIISVPNYEPAGVPCCTLDIMTHNYEFEKIYEEYHRRIFLYLQRIAGAADAEDLAQEVFNKVSKGLKDFQGKSNLSTWIYRIATNTVIDRTRSAEYRHAGEQISIEEDFDNISSELHENYKLPSTDRLVIRKEMKECIDEYIATLPHDYRTIITLSELEGLTNREIAEILSLSLENVKIRLHRARARLKEVLRDACDLYYTDENTLACDRKQTGILPKVPG